MASLRDTVKDYQEELLLQQQRMYLYHVEK